MVDGPTSQKDWRRHKRCGEVWQRTSSSFGKSESSFASASKAFASSACRFFALQAEEVWRVSCSLGFTDFSTLNSDVLCRDLRINLLVRLYQGM